MKNISSIRKKLSSVINKTLKSEVLKGKELACFDSLVSRRDFLKGSQKIATLGALATTGVMPSAWGSLLPEFSSNPEDFGITQEEMAQEEIAYTLSYSTEMYTQSVSSKDFVPATSYLSRDQNNSFASLEGFNYGQLKLQSELDSDTPIEGEFSDKNCNIGAPEMVQLKTIPGTFDLEVEVFEHNKMSCIDEDNQGGGFTTSVIPNSAFTYGLKADAANSEPAYIKTLHHPLHNSLDQTGNQMRGVQAFFVGGVIGSYYIRQSYLCVRWMRAEANLAGSEGNISEWEIIPIHSLLRQCSITPDRLDNVDIYTSSNGKTYLTLEINNGKGLVVLNINDFEELGVHYIDVPSTSGSSYHTKLTHISELNGALQFFISPKGEHAYQSIACDINPIKSKQLRFGDTGVFFQGHQCSNKELVSPVGLGESSYGSLYDISCIYEMGESSYNYWVPNKNTNATSIATIKLVLSTLFENINYVSLIAHDKYSGALVGFDHFTPSGLSNIGQLIELTGGRNKCGSFTFFSRDDNCNIQMYRQATLEDDTTPYQISSHYGKFTAVGNESITTNVFAEIPEFECSLSNNYGSRTLIEKSGFYLGDGVANIQCNPRFNEACEYISFEVDDETNKVNAFVTYNKMVEQTWITQAITLAVGLKSAQAENIEYKPCYQATIKPANCYGTDVSLGENQYLEIRGASPMKIMVNDERSYSIDRTQGALIPNTSGLDNFKIKVLAEGFACQLMVRIVDISNLQSGTDSALLKSANSQDTTSCWYSINLAQDSNDRMSSDEYNTSDKVENEAQKQELIIDTDATGTEKDGYQFLTDTTVDCANSMATMSEPTVKSGGFRASVGSLNSGIDPLFSMHIASTETVMARLSSDQFRSTQGGGYRLENGVLVKIDSNSVPPNDFGSFWKKSRKWGSDAFHSAKRASKKTRKKINGSLSFVTDPNSMLVTMRYSYEYMKDLGMEIYDAAVGDYVDIVIETAEQLADQTSSFISLAVKSVKKAINVIIELINFFLHLGDMISCISSASSLIKQCNREFQEEFSSGPYRSDSPSTWSTITSTMDNQLQNISFSNYSSDVNGTGPTMSSKMSAPCKKQFKKVMNFPLLSDVIMPAFDYFTSLISKLIGGAIDKTMELISPIIFKDLNLNTDSMEAALLGAPNCSLSNPETMLTEIVDLSWGVVQNPSSATEIACQLFDKYNDEFISDLEWTFDIFQNYFNEICSNVSSLFESNFITIQIPICTSFLKLFGINLSQSLSLRELSGLFLGIFYWVFGWVTKGKSYSSLPSPSFKTLVNSPQVYSSMSESGWQTCLSYFKNFGQHLSNILWLIKKDIQVKANDNSPELTNFLYDIFSGLTVVADVAFATVDTFFPMNIVPDRPRNSMYYSTLFKYTNIIAAAMIFGNNFVNKGNLKLKYGLLQATLIRQGLALCFDVADTLNGFDDWKKGKSKEEVNDKLAFYILDTLQSSSCIFKSIGDVITEDPAMPSALAQKNIKAYSKPILYIVEAFTTSNTIALAVRADKY